MEAFEPTGLRSKAVVVSTHGTDKVRRDQCWSMAGNEESRLGKEETEKKMKMQRMIRNSSALLLMFLGVHSNDALGGPLSSVMPWVESPTIKGPSTYRKGEMITVQATVKGHNGGNFVVKLIEKDVFFSNTIATKTISRSRDEIDWKETVTFPPFNPKKWEIGRKIELRVEVGGKHSNTIKVTCVK